MTEKRRLLQISRKYAAVVDDGAHARPRELSRDRVPEQFTTRLYSNFQNADRPVRPQGHGAAKAASLTADPATFPFCTVGAVDAVADVPPTEGGWRPGVVCTGTLVKGRLVLTAASVIWDLERRKWRTDFMFSPSGLKKSFPWKSAWVPTGFIEGTTPDYDFGVIELWEDLTAQCGHAGLRSGTFPQPITNVGCITFPQPTKLMKVPSIGCITADYIKPPWWVPADFQMYATPCGLDEQQAIGGPWFQGWDVFTPAGIEGYVVGLNSYIGFNVSAGNSEAYSSVFDEDFWWFWNAVKPLTGY